jgi:hypothetical protein
VLRAELARARVGSEADCASGQLGAWWLPLGWPGGADGKSPCFPGEPLVNHYFRHCDAMGLVWLDLETMGCAVHLLVVDHQARAAESESPARLRAGSTPGAAQTASNLPWGATDGSVDGTPWDYDPPRMTPLCSAAITPIDG